MSEDNGNSKQQSVTLPLDTIEAVEFMADNGVIASSKAAIYRHIIVNAVNDMIERGVVQKHIEFKKLRESQD